MTAALRSLHAVCLLFAASCVQLPPKKVLLVGIDGLRSEQWIAARTPTLDRLSEEGVLWLVSAGGSSGAAEELSTEPWAQLLTGMEGLAGDSQRISDEGVLAPDRSVAAASPAPHAESMPDAERMPDAVDPDAVDPIAVDVVDALPVRVRTLFGHTKALDPNLTTALFHTWSDLGLDADTLLSSSHEAIDYHFSPRNVGGRMPVAVRDAETTDAAAQAIAGGGRYRQADIDVMVVQWMQVALAARAHGVDSIKYRNSIEAVDHLMGRLIGAIETRAEREREQWLVLVTSDGWPPSGEPGANSESPILLRADRGELAESGEGPPSRLDVLPTALSWLAPPDYAVPFVGSGRVLWIREVPRAVPGDESSVDSAVAEKAVETTSSSPP